MNGWMGKIITIDLGSSKQEIVAVSAADAARLHRRPRPGRQAVRRPVPGAAGPLQRRQRPDLHDRPADRHGDDLGPLPGRLALAADRDHLRFQLGRQFRRRAQGRRAGRPGHHRAGRRRPVYLYVHDGERRGARRLGLLGTRTPSRPRRRIQAADHGQGLGGLHRPGRRKPRAVRRHHERQDRAAGRGGMGAIMGAKNLKAIAASGNQAGGHRRPGGLQGHDAPASTASSTRTRSPASRCRCWARRCWSTSSTPTACSRPTTSAAACSTTPRAPAARRSPSRCCSARAPATSARSAAAAPPGPGTSSGEGPEYERSGPSAPTWAISDLTAITEANYACNELGLDTITMGSTIGCAMELREAGAWRRSCAGATPASSRAGWTDTAYRRGIGAELALGSKRLAAKYGRPELAMQVKGMEIPAYDPRGAQGMALSYATSNRGGCHMRAYMIMPEILGHPVFLDRFSTAGKAEIVALFQDISAVVDSAVLCRFLQFAMGISTFSRDAAHGHRPGLQRRGADDRSAAASTPWSGCSTTGPASAAPTTPCRRASSRRNSRPGRRATAWCGSTRCSTTYYAVRGWDRHGVPLPADPGRTGVVNWPATITVKFYGLLRRRLGTAAIEIAADGLTILELLRAGRGADRAALPGRAARSGNTGCWTGTIILVNGENIRLKQDLETRVERRRHGRSVLPRRRRLT